MITVDTQFKPTRSLQHMVDYFESNYPDLDNFTVVLVLLNEYNGMIIDNGAIAFYQKAKAFGANAVILFDLHGWPVAPDNLEQAPVKTIVLSYDFTLYQKSTKCNFYYPNWLFFVQHKPIGQHIVPSYPLSCAGRNFNNGRAGKIYNYQKLKQQKYFNRILFTCWKNGDLEYFSIPTESQDPEFFQELEQFVSEYNTWPSVNDTNLSLINSMGALDIDIYTKSLFHLVAESRVIEPLLSEKTFKCLYVQQIPIFCAAAGTVSHLRDLGFDMFDDIVDHSKYDSITDWKQRIVAMHAVIDTVIDLDHDYILQCTQERRKHNFDLVNSCTIDKNIYDPIVKALKE